MYAYKKLKMPDGSTIDEHRHIMADLCDGFDTVVHHKDGNKRNNQTSNLEVMSRSEHAKYHGLGTEIKSPQQTPKVKPDDKGFYACRVCGENKPTSRFTKNSRKPYGFDSECKECHNARINDYHRRNK